MLCDDGMARSYPDGHDKLCFACSVTVEAKWDALPPSQVGHCSWCREETKQVLFRKRTIGRDEYICSSAKCGKATLHCRRGCGAFARKQASWAEEQCAKCDGTIKDWNDDTKLAVKGYCSWCCEQCSHTMIQKRLRRTLYECESCRCSTVVCSKCSTNLARAGALYDSWHCLGCQQESWDVIVDRRDTLFAQQSNRDRMIAELSRSSKWRDQAITGGVERPFLLLVSMPGFSRNQAASFLGFCMLTQAGFGDPHQEAWLVLSNMISRSTEASERLAGSMVRKCNWFDLLLRVGKTLDFSSKYASLSSKESQEKCIAGDQDIRDMEEEFVLNLIVVAEKHRKLMEKQKALWVDDDTSPPPPSPIVDTSTAEEDAALREKLRKTAGLQQPEVLKYGVNVVKFAARAPSNMALGLMAANWLVTSSSAFAAFAPVVGVASTTMVTLATPLFFIGLASL